MALVKATLKASIKSILQDMQSRQTDSTDEFAERLATAIDDYVKSGDGVYQTASLKAGATIVTSNTPVTVKLQ